MVVWDLVLDSTPTWEDVHSRSDAGGWSGWKVAGPFQQEAGWGTRAELDNIKTEGQSPHRHCMSTGWFVPVTAEGPSSTGLCGVLFCIHSVDASPEGLLPFSL